MSDDVDLLGDPGAVVEALHRAPEPPRERAGHSNGAHASLDMAGMLAEVLDERDCL